MDVVVSPSGLMTSDVPSHKKSGSIMGIRASQRLTGIENLESRQLMAGDTMGPIPVPDLGPDVDLVELRPDIQLDDGILDNLIPLPSDPLTGKWTNIDDFTGGLTED